MRICLVLTGGTIGSETNNDKCQLSDSLDWLNLAPDHDWQVVSPVQILSEEATEQTWLLIAEQIRSVADREEVDAFIVLHGTDTMSFTAAALSFYCLNIAQPIVITGSRLSPDADGSDAPTNFADAVIACQGLGPGCYLSFSGQSGVPSMIHSGTRVRKSRGDRPERDPRSFLGREPVARIEAGQMFAYRRAVRERHALLPEMVAGWRRTEIITLRPTLDWDRLMETIAEDRGYVIELYPSSTGPLVNLSQLLDQIEGQGSTAIAVTHDGLLAKTSYPSTEMIRNRISQVSFLPETAQIKLGWALANGLQGKDLESLMKTSLADERI